MSDRTETIKPVRIDLGDGDSLNLYRMSDYVTVVRFHGNNPNVQLSSAQVSTVALRAALDEIAPAGSYTRTDEADWKARAEKAERERDEAREACQKVGDDAAEAKRALDYYHELSKKYLRQRDEARGRADAAESRPLTPRQNLAALWESAHRPVGGRIPAGTAIITRSDHGNGDVRYQTLEATGRDLPDPGYTLERNYNYGPENGEEYRLLDPPARPEGAEEWEDWLIETMPHESMPDEDIARLADQIAARTARRDEEKR